jgi:hypothetical protein
MTRKDPSIHALGSPIFNPSFRLRTLLGKAHPKDGQDHFSPWSRVTKSLLTSPCIVPSGSVEGDDIVPLWLIEPADPGLRGPNNFSRMESLVEQLQTVEGPWPQRLFQSDEGLQCLYVSDLHAPDAVGFYLVNGGLIIARPGQRFRASRTALPAADTSPHRLPTPLDVWRHKLFARTVAASSNGLRSDRGDLEGAVVTLRPERWGLLPPWPPTFARPGNTLDHDALGLYTLSLLSVAVLNLLAARFAGVIVAVALVVVAICVMYGIRPAIMAHQPTGNLLLKVGRWSTYCVTTLALVAQTALRPDVSFIWAYAVPIVILVAAGPRRGAPWLSLILLSAAEYSVTAWIRTGG